MSDLAHDLRYALRQLRRNPSFALACVLTLALGLGATTAIYSVVDGVLLSPLPYPESDRLVRVWHSNARNDEPKETVSHETYRELVEGVPAIGAAAGISPHWSFTVRSPGEPERVHGYWISASFFDLLGIRPALGRGFLPEDDAEGAEPVVMLDHGYWRRKFGGDPDVVGRTLQLGSDPVTVVGVMPAGFRFGEEVALWLPLARNPLVDNGRQVRWVDVVARLAPGATVAQARRETAAFAARLAEAYPAANQGLGATVESLYEATVGDVKPALWTLLGGVGFLLLIVCSNLGNLFLARVSARRGELAVRGALGAGPARVARQLLTESLALGLLGGLLGVLLGFWLLELFRAVGPQDLPRLQEVRLDLAVLGVAGSLALVVGLGLGLAPALFASRAKRLVWLKTAGRGGSGMGGRLRDGVVVAQVALAVVLLAGAGLLLRSFLEVTRVDPGFRAEGVLTLQFGRPSGLDPAGAVAFYDRLFEDLQALPGVSAAGAVTRLPLGGNISTRLEVRGRALEEGELPEVEFRRAGGSYFEAMGIPLLRGRAFGDRDRPDSPPVMIASRAAAERLWPDEDPVGRHVRFAFAGDDAPWVEVVGVVGDVKHFGLEAEAPPIVYVPFSQGPPGSPLLAVRTPGDPLALAGPVRETLRALAPDIVTWDLRPMAAHVDRSVAARRFLLLLIGFFGVLALLLAAVGIYGVIAFGVRRRTREIGVRMALGADRAAVVRMVVSRGLRLAGPGLALGLLAALLLTRLIRGLLFGVTPADPLALGGVVLLLGGVAAFASWLPSRLAVRVDPMTVLREE